MNSKERRKNRRLRGAIRRELQEVGLPNTNEAPRRTLLRNTVAKIFGYVFGPLVGWVVVALFANWLFAPNVQAIVFETIPGLAGCVTHLVQIRNDRAVDRYNLKIQFEHPLEDVKVASGYETFTSSGGKIVSLGSTRSRPEPMTPDPPDLILGDCAVQGGDIDGGPPKNTSGATADIVENIVTIRAENLPRGTNVYVSVSMYERPRAPYLPSQAKYYEGTFSYSTLGVPATRNIDLRYSDFLSRD